MVQRFKQVRISQENEKWLIDHFGTSANQAISSIRLNFNADDKITRIVWRIANILAEETGEKAVPMDELYAYKKDKKKEKPNVQKTPSIV